MKGVEVLPTVRGKDRFGLGGVLDEASSIEAGTIVLPSSIIVPLSSNYSDCV